MSTLIRSGMRGIVFILGLALLPLTGLRAAEDVKKPSSPHVVLVGISDYTDPQIKDRAHAEADVKALYDLLTSKEHLGVKADDIRLLLGKKDEKRPSEVATRANILEALKWVKDSAKRDDLVIFAFIGQGSSLGDRGDRTCYFASDSTLKDRSKNALAAADIAQEFDKIKSKNVCILLDVNFKGFDAGKDTTIPEASLGEVPYKEFLGDDEAEEHNPLPGRIIYMATNGLTASPDLEKNGLFAHAVLEGLKGEADKEGYEPDGVVTADELTEYLNKEIPELKRKHAKNTDARRNEHFIFGSQESHFVLTVNPKASAKARARLEKLNDAADKLGAEQAQEGRRLLERMPRLQAMRDLRKEYQKFLDGDITLDQFKAARTTVLASMRLPETAALKFADTVVEAIDLVDKEYVKEIKRGELVAHAIRGLYRKADERIAEDLNEKLGQTGQMSKEDLYLLLKDARKKLGKREDLDKHKDIDVALQRMLARLDPYTTYVDPETVKRFEIEYKGQFTGIGVQIRKDNETGSLQVVTPIKGSPSYKKGLLAGDLITTIIRDVDSDGERLDKAEVIQTKDIALNEAVKKILGKENTKVRLMIQREGVEKPFEVEIVRGRIELESVFGVKRKADDSWDYWLDADKKIGYVRMSNFARNTAGELTRVVKMLKDQGMQGFILDLRFNPGGLLTSAEQVSDLFIDDGPIVSIRMPRKGVDNRKDGRKAGSQLDFPMVVLVNGGSASASEIVSACLQDHGRAVVIGERSFGKGSVQNISDFDGGQIKITIASFWRPSGKNLNKSSTGGKDDDEWGVMPDKGFKIELARKERDDLFEHLRNTEIIPRRDKPAKEVKAAFQDRQLDKAIEHLKEKQKASK